MEEMKVKEERARYREFTVTPGLCGFKVKIGCSEAYFSSAADVQREINNYLNDPDGTTRRIQRENIRFDQGPMPTTTNFEPARAYPPAEICVAR